MQQIHVVFSDRDVGGVADVVVRLGTLQVVDSVEMESWAGTLEKAGTGEEPDSLRQRRDSVERLIRALKLSDSLENLQPETSDWEEIDERVESISHRVREEESVRDQYEQECDRLREIRRRIDEAPSLGFPIENRDAYSYLAVEMGRVVEANLDILRNRLEGVLHVITPLNTLAGMTTLIVITLRRDKNKLDAALQEAGFQRLEADHFGPSVSPEVAKDIDRQIHEIDSKLEQVQSRLDGIAREQDHFLRRTLFRIRREALKEHIYKYFRKTEHTYLLSGWLPSARLAASSRPWPPKRSRRSVPARSKCPSR
jgi:vacuolar-type H+-ATPase subunit I/STV1